MKRNIISSRGLALSLFTLVLSASSLAQASEYFGERGQLFLRGGSSAGSLWSFDTQKDNQRKPAQAVGALDVGAGLFVARNVFVGLDGALLVGLGDYFPGVFTLTPRLGGNIDFGRGVSLLPSLGASYRQAFSKGGLGQDGVGQSPVADRFHLVAEAPLALQITPHGALLVGPTLEHQFGANRLSLGARAGLLLWL